YSNTNRIRSSTTLLAFQGMSLCTRPTNSLQCQERPRFNLSTMSPVRTSFEHSQEWLCHWEKD
ncbi:MAG TPA: hypothetical protein VMU53_10895, partial [Candidatus Sulfotelmatobacter sp.]|nr:hypothetical protein [Candidatus Sulfotelmatobacter sp.]